MGFLQPSLLVGLASGGDPDHGPPVQLPASPSASTSRRCGSCARDEATAMQPRRGSSQWLFAGAADAGHRVSRPGLRSPHRTADASVFEESAAQSLVLVLDTEPLDDAARRPGRVDRPGPSLGLCRDRRDRSRRRADRAARRAPAGVPAGAVHHPGPGARRCPSDGSAGGCRAADCRHRSRCESIRRRRPPTSRDRRRQRSASRDVHRLAERGPARRRRRDARARWRTPAVEHRRDGRSRAEPHRGARPPRRSPGNGCALRRAGGDHRRRPARGRRARV